MLSSSFNVIQLGCIIISVALDACFDMHSLAFGECLVVPEVDDTVVHASSDTIFAVL